MSKERPKVPESIKFQREHSYNQPKSILDRPIYQNSFDDKEVSPVSGYYSPFTSSLHDQPVKFSYSHSSLDGQYKRMTSDKPVPLGPWKRTSELETPDSSESQINMSLGSQLCAQHSSIATSGSYPQEQENQESVERRSSTASKDSHNSEKVRTCSLDRKFLTRSKRWVTDKLHKITKRLSAN